MRTVTILAQDACAMAFQMCRTSAGRPLRMHYTTTPPRMFIFSEAETWGLDCAKSSPPQNRQRLGHPARFPATPNAGRFVLPLEWR